MASISYLQSGNQSPPIQKPPFDYFADDWLYEPISWILESLPSGEKRRKAFTSLFIKLTLGEYREYTPQFEQAIADFMKTNPTLDDGEKFEIVRILELLNKNNTTSGWTQEKTRASVIEIMSPNNIH